MQHTTDEKPVSEMSYWEIIAEIDASYFVIDQIKNRFSSRAPIVQMIDEATGYDKKSFEDVKKIVARIKELQAALPPDDPHFKLGTDLHPTTAARINPCRNPEPHIVGSLPCCAGIIFRPEPVVEPIDE